VNGQYPTGRLFRALPALRFRDFRLLWTGQLISQAGTEMQRVAINLNNVMRKMATIVGPGLAGFVIG